MMRFVLTLLAIIGAGALQAATVSVLDYGAKGDRVADDTAAFQNALDVVAKTGGIVRVPAGNYRIDSHLNVPTGVTLEGEWTAPPRLNAHPGEEIWQRLKGSILLASEGAGQTEGSPFVTLNTSSTLKGIIIYYPDQTNTNPPVPYPWTVASGGADNCSIVDVLMVNPYQAVDFGTRVAGRHYIRNLYAQALHIGLFVDQCYDIGRVENVHFWPFWVEGPAWDYTKEHGTAFIFGRTDWEYVSGSFCIGYNVGFKFTKFNSGPGNVLLTQSGSDVGPIGVLVEDSQYHAGVSFSNSQMYGSIVVGEKNNGPVRFTGCGLFGSTNGYGGVSHADLAGLGAVSFSNCHFMRLDPKNEADLVIRASNYYLNINGCDFMTSGQRSLLLQEGLSRAIITNNLFRGRMNVENHSKGKVIIDNNLDDQWEDTSGGIVVDDMYQVNGRIEKTGTWSRGATALDYEGAMHWSPKGDGQSAFKFVPLIPSDGNYEVYVWFGADMYDDHAADVPAIIVHRDGTDTVRFSQRERMGEWVRLGAWNFAKGDGGSLTITNGASGNVLADAVKFVPAAAE